LGMLRRAYPGVKTPSFSVAMRPEPEGSGYPFLPEASRVTGAVSSTTFSALPRERG
jgi:hypothetical protein